MIIPAGTIKRIHVDRRVLALNKKLGGNAPAITIQTSKGSIKSQSVEILGVSTFVQAGIAGRRPLSCGAKVWVETKGPVSYVPNS